MDISWPRSLSEQIFFLGLYAGAQETKASHKFRVAPVLIALVDNGTTVIGVTARIGGDRNHLKSSGGNLQTDAANRGITRSFILP